MLDQLSHYKMLDRIGAGAMGEVYRARDTRLGRTVAIKVLPQDVAGDPDRRDRFRREAQAAAALSHPNIAALFEIGEDQGQLFLAFEFVPGRTLSNEIGGRAMNPRQAIHLAMQIADALADAHAAGIMHRDLKPDNVIVTPKGHAKILDFGLAKWTAGGADRDRAATVLETGAGIALGTVAYMSPEQALGEAVDHRTDIFSLGIVLHEMLTGSRPFQGPTATAVALQIVQAPAPPPSSINRNVPVELDAIVAGALSKKIDGRYESAATLAAELRAIDAILDVRSEAIERASAAAAGAKPARAIGKWVAAALVVVAAGGGAWYERGPLARAWRRMLGPPPSPLIAVVPFETDADQIVFADGLAEDLITRLGQTPGLKVMGRSATRTYRGRAPQDVARATGAAVILTGSVHPAADTVKVSLELVDATDGTALWSSQYTRDVKDIFAVQAEVAEHVAAALRLKLQPTPSSVRAAARTVDPRAYERYVRGRKALSDRRPESIALFEQAIAADAGLAEAFAGVAEALEFEAIAGGVPLDAARRQRQQTAAERAYQLDPDLPQANLAMGLSSRTLGDALGYLRRAIEIDPSYGEGLHQIGDQIIDFDAALAIQFYRASLAADPALETSHSDLALALAAVDQTREAHAEVDRIRVEAIPGWRDVYHVLVDFEEQRPDRAVERLDHTPLTAPGQTALRIRALATAGRFQEAAAVARTVSGDGPCALRATVAAVRRATGDPAAARALLNATAAQARSETVEPDMMRCAVYAAAAMGDQKTAAALLERIAGREEWLRYWALQILADRGSVMLRGRTFPWNRIVSAPAMIAARATLDAAYARERDTARSVLAGLLK